MEKIVYDSHNHTPLSNHCVGWPKDFVKEGIRKNLKGICFTDHAPLAKESWENPIWSMSPRNLNNYISLIEEVREEFKKEIDVTIGLEIDYFPIYDEHVKQISGCYDFDYLLGSIHPINPDIFEKTYVDLTPIEAYKLYYVHMKKAAKSGNFDCLAHPDLIRRCYDDEFWDFSKFKDDVCEFLDIVKENDIALEYNTSGLVFSKRMYPCNEMLELIREREIPMVLGSDSHDPDRVGDRFKEALTNLKKIGFKEVCYYKKRKRFFYNIDDAIKSLI